MLVRSLRSLNNEPLLTSTLAAGIVQDTFDGEAGECEGGEEEKTGDYSYRYLYQIRLEIPEHLTFLSQNINTCMRIRNRHTYYLHIIKI